MKLMSKLPLKLKKILPICMLLFAAFAMAGCIDFLLLLAINGGCIICALHDLGIPISPFARHPGPGELLRSHSARMANVSGAPNPEIAPFFGNLSVITPPFSSDNNDIFELQRQADCSLTYLEFSVAENASKTAAIVTPVSQSSHFEKTIHNSAFLNTTSGVFPHGCVYNNAGNTSRLLADLGMGKNGRELIATQGTNVVLASGIKSDGTYTTELMLATDIQPLTVVGGDLNGDGNPDLVSVNNNGLQSSITVFLGKADGTYQAGVNLALPGSAARWAVIDDLNGDGNLDILASSSDSFSIFLGKGDGTFQAAQIFAPANVQELFTNAFITADVNGDGKKDIITANGLVFLGKGDGVTYTPVAQTGLPANLTGTSSYAPALVAADFNKDGKPDLAIDDGTTIHIYKGNGDGTFSTGPAYATIADYGFLIATDVDGDGNIDLWSGYGGNSGLSGDAVNVAYALMGNGDGTFQGAPSLPVAYTGSNLADLNGDGRPDLVSVVQAGTQTTVTTFLTNTQGIPVAGPQLVIPAGGGADSFVLGTFHGGTRNDLVYLSPAPQTQSYFVAVGNADGSFQTPTQIAIPSLVPSGLDVNETITGLRTADFNHDGKPDLIASFSDQDAMSQIFYQGFLVQLGNGDGTFTAPQLTITYQSLTAPQIFFSNQLSAVADVTGDSFPDVFMVIPNGIVAGTAQHQTQLFVGKGDGTFKAANTLTLTGNVRAPDASGAEGSPFAVADLNGDGKADLVAAGSSSDGTTPQMAIALGNGDGTFKPATILTLDGFGYIGSPALADFDGDGKLDLVLQGIIEGSGMGILHGNGDGTFQTISNGDNTVSASSLFALSIQGGAVATDLNGDGKPDLVVGNVVLLNKTGALVPPTLAATTTAVTSSPNPSTSGAAVTFTATVTSTTAGMITGTVTFFDGATSIGTGAVGAGGIATLMTSSLTDGAHSITAQYGGDASYATSISAALTQAVNAAAKAATSTGLTSSLNPSTAGASVTFTATVTSTTAGTITGMITFFDGGTSIGTGTVGAGGVATLMTSSLTVAAHTITAQYGGDGTYAGSTSAAVTQTVNAAVKSATSTALSSSLNPSSTGASVTFTATVTSTKAGTITGTVTFFDGGTSLGTGSVGATGIATLANSTLAAGGHSVTAQYGGDTNYAASTSPAVTQTVTAAPDFTVSANPNVLSIVDGQTGSVVITVTPQNGSTQTVSFACSGLPTAAACSFMPASVPLDGTHAGVTQLLISTVAPTSGGMMLGTIQPPTPGRLAGIILISFLGIFCLSLTQLRVTSRRLALVVLLLAVSVGFVAACGSSPTPHAGTPKGTSQVSITASSGNDSHAAVVTITVQ